MSFKLTKKISVILVLHEGFSSKEVLFGFVYRTDVKVYCLSGKEMGNLYSDRYKTI